MQLARSIRNLICLTATSYAVMQQSLIPGLLTMIVLGIWYGYDEGYLDEQRRNATHQ